MASKQNGGGISAGRRHSGEARAHRSAKTVPVTDVVRRNPNALRRILSEIEVADVATLRVLWRTHLGSEPPSHKSRELTAMRLAWEIQTAVLGGFDAWTTRRLRELAAQFEGDPGYKPQASITLRPGLVLTRDWQGVRHRVLVQADGFLHQGTTYQSLTTLARAITGTAWSGPRFFGLEVKAASSKRKDAP